MGLLAYAKKTERTSETTWPADTHDHLIAAEAPASREAASRLPACAPPAEGLEGRLSSLPVPGQETAEYTPNPKLSREEFCPGTKLVLGQRAEVGVLEST